MAFAGMFIIVFIIVLIIMSFMFLLSIILLIVGLVKKRRGKKVKLSVFYYLRCFVCACCNSGNSTCAAYKGRI